MSSGSYSVGSMPYTGFVAGIGNLLYPGNIGYVSSKSWNGADRVKGEKQTIAVPRINPRWKGEGDVKNVKWLWKQVKWRGDVPKNSPQDEHPYSCTWDTSESPVGWMLQDPNKDGIWDLGGWGAPPQMGCWFNPTSGYESPWSSNDDIALTLELRGKVAGPDFHAGMALAEIDKTAMMIANHAKVIRRTGTLVRQGRFVDALKMLTSHREASGLQSLRRRGKELATTVASKHLEYVYGVAPLIGDVYAGAQYLAHQMNVPRQRIYRASRERRYKNDPAAFLSGDPPGSIYGRVPETSWLGTRKSIKLIVTEVNPVKLSGVTDVASIVWERVPYSFVFDWFIPVGQWLEALNFSSAVTGTYVTSTKTGWRWSGCKSTSPYFACSFPGKLGMEHGVFTRTVSGSPPISLPTFKPWGKIASMQHAANAVSLLITGHASKY